MLIGVDKLDVVNITKELYQGSKRLEEGSNAIFLLAKAMAETERNYRSALAKEKLSLKDDGMAIGLINDVAMGNVSDLKFGRDLAELQYQAGRDSMRAIMAQLNSLQSILRIQKDI